MRTVKPACSALFRRSAGIVLFTIIPASRVHPALKLRRIEFIGESWIEQGPPLSLSQGSFARQGLGVGVR